MGANLRMMPSTRSGTGAVLIGGILGVLREPLPIRWIVQRNICPRVSPSFGVGKSCGVRRSAGSGVSVTRPCAGIRMGDLREAMAQVARIDLELSWRISLS